MKVHTNERQENQLQVKYIRLQINRETCSAVVLSEINKEKMLLRNQLTE